MTLAPTPLALWIAAFSSPRPFSWKVESPLKPRTMNRPFPYAVQYRYDCLSVPMSVPPMNTPYGCGWLFNPMNFSSVKVAFTV